MSEPEKHVDSFTDEGDRAMDRRLRSHAGAWSDDLLADAPGPASWRSPRSLLWSGPALAAVAVTIAVVIGVAVAIGANGSEPSPSALLPTASGSPRSDVVPWRDLPATFPRLARTEEIAAARPCTASDLRLDSTSRADGASGVEYFGVGVHVRGMPCRLDAGYPVIQVALDGSTNLDEELSVPAHGSGLPVEPVLVTAASPAVLTLAAPTESCPAVKFDQIVVRLPDIGLGGRVAADFSSSCSAGIEHRPLRIFPVRSEQPRPTVSSPYDHIRVQGDMDVTVHEGDPARFELVLTSSVDLPLVPCPDYAVLTSLGRQRAGLNCGGVRFRDSRGRPYLPAGRPVTFAFEARTGDKSSENFTWELITPLKQVSKGGSLTVESGGIVTSMSLEHGGRERVP